MAFSFVGHRGVATTKTTGTTLPVTVSGANIPSGALVIVRCLTDNGSLTQGATTAHSVTDSQGNSYTRIVEWTRTDGGAGDGVTTSVHYSVLTTGLTAGSDTVTLSSTNVVARVIGLDEFATAGVAGATGSGAAGSGTSPSASLADLTSRAYLLIGVAGREAPVGSSYTNDADYTLLTEIGTSGGGATSNISDPGGYRIATLTGDTFAPSITSADWSCVLAALYEADAGGDETGQFDRVYTVLRALRQYTPGTGSGTHTPGAGGRSTEV